MKKEKILIIPEDSPSLEEAVKSITPQPPGTLLEDILSVPREEWPIEVQLKNPHPEEVTPAEKQAIFEGMAVIRKGREQ